MAQVVVLHVPGDLGDVGGLVADALHVGDHLQGGGHRPQIPGHRLLPQQQAHALALDLPLLLVDLLLQDVGPGPQLHVPVQQGLGGGRDGLLAQGPHPDQLHIQLIQLFVKGVSH